jgi:predicted TIM-barrel fold metal-dependent hydrolase
MPVFKFMEERGLVLSMCLGNDENQIAEMREVIQECPRLKVAIGHFGMVTTPSFRSQVLLARCGENVMIESGGITWLYNSEFYPYPSAIRSIIQAAEWVGMEHLMWGSDYPRTITAITYKMSYDFIQKTTELTDEDKKLFLGGNAVRFYGFTNLPSLPYIKNMSE